ncbi:type II toxin-antitoxin system HicA family toxin [Thiohalomonas denitrificans]|uniref:type II toxin-antitoxin system HicA family toxin n=1 Tax=Thiohalomonas denitrificans TaxID=415747 RepID=UPI0026F277D4|nr:type II toxin-antitoxin system HicA family toxin [Thiohalomonas denitrificans]
MSRHEKLVERFKEIPADFEWNELESLLTGLGYKPVQGSGSRVRFVHESTRRKILLHKPHPEKTIKQVYLKQVKQHLEEVGLL